MDTATQLRDGLRDQDAIGLPCPLTICYWQSAVTGNILGRKGRKEKNKIWIEGLGDLGVLAVRSSRLEKPGFPQNDLTTEAQPRPRDSDCKLMAA